MTACWFVALWGLVRLYWNIRLFLVAVSIGCRPIKFVPRRETILSRFFLLVHIRLLLDITRFVCGCSFEGLIAGRIYFIFIFYWFSINGLSGKFIFVLRVPFKRNILVFIFNPWDYFLPHLWFMAGKMTLIGGADASIRLVWFSLWDKKINTLWWWFLPGINWVFVIIVLIRWNFLKRTMDLI